MASVGDSSSAPVVNSKIIAAAISQLGVPYVWGGTEAKSISDVEGKGTEGGFDCAGLTQWCALQAGVSIARTSQEQWAILPHVNSPIPGDLVFFVGALARGEEAPGHVGIVTAVDTDGNATQMIDAPYTGTVVRYDSVTPGTAYGIVGYAMVPSGAFPAAYTRSGREKPSEATTAPVEETPQFHYAGTCLVGLPVLREGDYGETVMALCELLGQDDRSINFTDTIVDAVKFWQREAGLTVDGIVGVQTWTSLLTGKKVSA
jgi:hypothetical protein